MTTAGGSPSPETSSQTLVRPAVPRQVLGEPSAEPRQQATDVVETELGGLSAGGRVGRPVLGVDLVAADADDRGVEERDDGVQRGLCEVQRSLVRAQDVRVETPPGPHLERLGRPAAGSELGVGGEQSLHVPRQVDLGDDRDAPGPGERDDLPQVLLGVPAAVRGVIERTPVDSVNRRGVSPRGDLLEPRVPGDGQPPSLVVGEVEVQDVELALRGKLDEPHHLVLRQEVPGDVEQDPAVLQARRVLDHHGREGDGCRLDGCGAVGARPDELLEGPHRVQGTGHPGRLDPDGLPGVEPVRLGRQGRVEGERQVRPGRTAPRHVLRHEEQADGCSQNVLQQRPDPVQLGGDRHQHPRRKGDLGTGDLDVRRAGNERVSGPRGHGVQA